MAKAYYKIRFWTSLVTSKMPTVTTVRKHHPWSRMPRINSKCWSSCRQSGLLHCHWECKLHCHSENLFTLSSKAKHTSAYDSEISFLDICLAELSAYVHSKTCSRMFTAALFISPLMEANQLSSNWRMNKRVWNTIEYHLAIKMKTKK